MEDYNTVSQTFSIDTTQDYNIFNINLSNIIDIDTFLQTPISVLQYNIDTTINITLTDSFTFNGNDYVWSIDTNVTIVDSVISVLGNVPTYSFSCFVDTTLSYVDTSLVLTWDTIPTSQTVSITQNLPAQNPTWTPEDMGLGNVPTFAIRQQYYPGDNYGQIYIATHGRGMYKSGSFVARNDEDLNEEVEEVLEEVIGVSMHVYPNPVSNQLTIDFMSEYDVVNVDVNIYDLTGKVLIHKKVDLVMGSNQIPMDVSTLPKGTYLVHLNNGLDSQYAKIVKAY